MAAHEHAGCHTPEKQNLFYPCRWCASASVQICTVKQTSFGREWNSGFGLEVAVVLVFCFFRHGVLIGLSCLTFPYPHPTVSFVSGQYDLNNVNCFDPLSLTQTQIHTLVCIHVCTHASIHTYTHTQLPTHNWHT